MCVSRNNRIHSIFSLWLSHYWNDFYGSHARKHIILFLDRISKYESLTPICDSLAPLAVREPPSEDPDKLWGLFDDQVVEECISPPPTPTLSSSKTKRRNEKKDSAYASGTFSISGFILEHQPASSSPLSSPTKNEPFLLKRLSGNSTFSAKQKPLPRTISTNNDTTTIPTPLLSPNLNRLLLRRQSGRKVMTHSESQPDLRSSYATGNKNILSPTTTTNVDKVPRQAEFAGGLINIDTMIKCKNGYMSPSIAPSVATTNGGRWGSSLGHHLMASSFISSFRQNKSDKDQTSHDYKSFMKYTNAIIADQLTWIEAELFSRIKVTFGIFDKCKKADKSIRY